MLDNFRVYLKNLLASFPAILFAITIHEFSHGYTAYLMGDDTAKRAGRLTLNPFKHLDPIGTITLLLFKFGWARPVPVNFWKLRNVKLGIIIVSLAGPVSNLIMAFASGFIFFKFGLYKYSTIITVPYRLNVDPIIMYLCDVLAYFIFFNIVLAVFNLIPIPPLDGSKIIMAFLPRKYLGWYAKYEIYGVIVLIILLIVGIIPMIMTPFIDYIMDLIRRMAV
ncbi:MAG TPA: site-2 protease family protein [Thermotogales bacterium]|nr:site-2 protease family protein [Thermotogales bacterium]